MKNNSLKFGLIVGSILLMTSCNTFGQSDQKQRGKHKPPSFEELLEKMDSNKDGKLSKKEIKGPLKNDFARIDDNKDGFITKEELKKAPKPKRGPKRKK